MPLSPRPRRLLTATAFAAVAAGALATSAQAVVTASVPGQPSPIGYATYDVSTSGARGSNGSLDLQGGLYVIGDSLSMSPLSGPGVPYREIANQYLVKGRVAVRAYGGGSVLGHLEGKGWPSNGSGTPKTSVTDAINSKASTVFVMLGTNDLSCMHYSYFMPAQTSSGGCGPAVGTQNELPLGNTTYANWRISQLGTLQVQAKQLIDPLIAAGKCVIWAGPREAESYGSHPADWAQFNNWLKGYRAGKDNMLAYADWTAYAKADPLKTDFNTIYPTNWGNNVITYDRDVHPRNPASGTEIAKFATFYAAAPKGTGCAMARK